VVQPTGGGSCPRRAFRPMWPGEPLRGGCGFLPTPGAGGGTGFFKGHMLGRVGASGLADTATGPISFIFPRTKNIGPPNGGRVAHRLSGGGPSRGALTCSPLSFGALFGGEGPGSAIFPHQRGGRPGADVGWRPWLGAKGSGKPGVVEARENCPLRLGHDHALKRAGGGVGGRYRREQTNTSGGGNQKKQSGDMRPAFWRGGGTSLEGFLLRGHPHSISSIHPPSFHFGALGGTI